MPRISKYTDNHAPKTKTHNTALYIRLSREDGDKLESDSIINQRHMLETFVDNHSGFEVIDTYCDENYTGTNFERPDFKRMINDVKLKKINCIIVKDLSRFGRDYIDMGVYLEKFLPEHGVRFIAINDNIDSEKTEYDMMMPIKNVYNAQYARDISTKVQSALKTKQLRGEFIGAFASYGYLKDPNNKNKIIKDDYAALIVQRIFAMFLEGKGKISIAMTLNREGVLCPSEYKKQSGLNYNNGNRLSDTRYWTYATIHRMLNNEIYIGNMVQGRNNRSSFSNKTSVAVDKKDWVVVKRTHEPIIDPETWTLVQDLLQRDTRIIDFSSNISLFAGFVKCKDCGRAMCKTVRNKVASYLCGSYKRYGAGTCTSHSIKEDVLHNLVLDNLKTYIEQILSLDKIISDMDMDKKVEQSQRIIKERLSKLQAEKERVYKLKKAIYEDYKLEELSKEDYLRYKDDYEIKEKNIDLQIESLEQEYNQKNVDIEREWIKQFKKHKNISELDRDVLAAFIENIYINEEKTVEIKYKFSKQADTLLNITNNIAK